MRAVHWISLWAAMALQAQAGLAHDHSDRWGVDRRLAAAAESHDESVPKKAADEDEESEEYDSEEEKLEAAETERRETSSDEPLANPGVCGKLPGTYLTCSSIERFCGGEFGAPTTSTAYTPKHKGIAFDALNLESEACPVPAESYRLLDDVVGTVLERVGALPKPRDEDDKARYVLAVSRITGEVLFDKGFRICNTKTLGDALDRFRPRSAPPRHFVDCDTGSLILLTVAETLGLPAALVEILLPTGAGHNFVRWEIDADTTIDWDTNARAQCKGPNDVQSFRGRAMSADEIMAYLLMLRADSLWVKSDLSRSSQEIREHELADLAKAIDLFPEHPSAYANFIWIVATKQFGGREMYKTQALRYAQTLLNLERRPATLDSVACIYALDGDFDSARTYEKEAIAATSDAHPEKAVLKRRLEFFEMSPPRNCTGWE